MIYVGSIIFMFIHISAMGIATIIFGARIDHIAYGYEPFYAKFSVKNINIRLGLIMAGGYLKHTLINDDIVYYDNIKHYENLSQLKKLIIVTSGCVLSLILAWPALGLSGLIEYFVNTPRNIYDLFLYGFNDYYIHSTIEAYNNSPLILFSIILIKLSFVNLIPFPPYSGGEVIKIILERYCHDKDKLSRTFAVSSTIFTLLIFIYFLRILWKTIFG